MFLIRKPRSFLRPVDASPVQRGVCLAPGGLGTARQGLSVMGADFHILGAGAEAGDQLGATCRQGWGRG